MSNRLEPRVTALETQVERVAAILDRVERGMEKRDEAMLQRIEELARPRYSFISTIMITVLTVGGACFALLARENQHTRELLQAAESRSDRTSDRLDTKLQMEQRLLNDTINIRVTSVNEASRERHDIAMRETQRNRDWIDYLIRRQLRLGKPDGAPAD